MGVKDLEALPQRVFLDSCTLQTLRDFGQFVWEGQALDVSRLKSIPDGEDNVRALRRIFVVNERAMFEWILSDSSIAEAADKNDPGHLRWAFDVLDHSMTCLNESGGPTQASQSTARQLDSATFDCLSAKDRRLIRDAVLLDCDAFLTMERRLPRNATHIEREVGLRVLTPVQHWSLLEPWAALYA